MISRVCGTLPVLESLAHFDTSKTKWLEIERGSSPSGDPLYRVLLPMTLTLDRCVDPLAFVRALDPSMNSSGDVACPRLEELVIMDDRDFDFKGVVRTAAARALRGVGLKTVRTFSPSKNAFPQPDMMELEKHVSHVKLC